ncbi:MAG: hypothetical protein IIW86_03500 [Clostridia bacterium]|nr:hypothetical protein [Clostridia bacterium]
MFDFLNRPLNNGETKPPPLIDDLTRQLSNAIKAQYINGNITAADIQKVIQLANNAAKLRSALKWL